MPELNSHQPSAPKEECDNCIALKQINKNLEIVGSTTCLSGHKVISAPHTEGSEWEKSFGQYYERFLKLYRKALPNEKGNFPDEMAYDLFLELKSLIQKLLQTAREERRDYFFNYLNISTFGELHDLRFRKGEAKARSQVIDEAVEMVEGMPTRCSVCGSTGVNRVGECECAYEDKGYIRKSDVLLQLKGQDK